MTKAPDLTTLHAALDIYAEQIGKQAGHTSAATLSNRQAIVALLKRYHDDIPLHAIDLTACVAMMDLWKNRPVNQKTGKPYTAKTAAKALSELIRFFWWLDTSEQFSWKSPSHFGQISRRVVSLPSDRRRLHREKFSVEHLATLYHHTTPMQRLMLCLAMNCGMGAAEMGRLKCSNLILGVDGDFVIDLMPDEGILRFVRPKTGVFGEWLLWSETVEAVRQAIARSEELGSDLLFVTDDGTPMWKDDASNPSFRFHHLWRRFLMVVQNDGVPNLPLGTIRKQMAEQIRRKVGDAVAQTFLGHIGNAHHFDLYVDGRFRQLHEALRQLRISLASVFEQRTS